MKPLLKQDWVNLPLSIQAEWKEFFEQTSSVLGISRNAALCLALKFGGPILGQYVQVMRAELKLACAAISKVSGNTPMEISEILGPPEMPGLSDTKPGYERKRASKRRAGAPEPGNSPKGRQCGGQAKA